MPTTDLKIPPITPAQLAVALVDSKTLGAAGPGGDAFQQAIQCSNNRDAQGAISAFEKALTLGLDPLRQGYAHANLGALKLKRGALATAAEHLLAVLTFKQALYESVHDAAQYLSVILSELGRVEEARALQGLSAQTQAKLGYSLSPSVAEEVRQLVRRSQNPIAVEEAASPADTTATATPKKAPMSHDTALRVVTNAALEQSRAALARLEATPEGAASTTTEANYATQAEIRKLRSHIEVYSSEGRAADAKSALAASEEVLRANPGSLYLAAACNRKRAELAYALADNALANAREGLRLPQEAMMGASDAAAFERGARAAEGPTAVVRAAEIQLAKLRGRVACAKVREDGQRIKELSAQVGAGQAAAAQTIGELVNAQIPEGSLLVRLSDWLARVRASMETDTEVTPNSADVSRRTLRRALLELLLNKTGEVDVSKPPLDGSGCPSLVRGLYERGGELVGVADRIVEALAKKKGMSHEDATNVKNALGKKGDAGPQPERADVDAACDRLFG